MPLLYNTIQSAIGALWVGIDETLDEVFGDKTTLAVTVSPFVMKTMGIYPA